MISVQAKLLSELETESVCENGKVPTESLQEQQQHVMCCSHS